MKTIFYAIIMAQIAICVPSAFSFTERKLYVGTDATETTLTFDHFVEIDSRTKPSLKEAKAKIEAQVNHLFGPMGVAEYTAVPKGNHKISKIEISAISASLFKAKYSYTGTIVLKNGPTTTYEITLPNNPDRIYQAGLIGDHNPCTDEHYQSAGDFWYFWNPRDVGCKLKRKDDYEIVKGKIKRNPNTEQSYPEYERLADKNSVIHLSILMGMNDPKEVKDPNTSSDINGENFRVIKQALLAKSFQSRVWPQAEIEKYLKVAIREKVYLEEFTKKSGKFVISLRIFFGPSGIDEKSKAFHYFFKDGVENSAVMMYAGHSGLGGHLDLSSIEQTEGFTITPNTKKYQIYYFNSCSSYTYYNTMFFDRKITDQDPNGTKNLDILTNGLATYFSVMPNTNLAIVDAIDVWAQGKGKLSYQAIAKENDSGNLFGINGDDDNQ